MGEDPKGKYTSCYVAYLDVLGFREQVDKSSNAHDPATTPLVRLLHDITAVSAEIDGLGKLTEEDGVVPMQIRTFSDSICIFTPSMPRAKGRRRLAHLLFLVRYLHDKIASMEACFRGAIAKDQMFWYKAWSLDPEDQTTTSIPPVTFGPGLMGAYRAEQSAARVPRVIVMKEAFADMHEGDAFPFASPGQPLSHYCKQQGDDPTLFLDLLHEEIERSPDEKCERIDGHFTITRGEPGGVEKLRAMIIESAAKQIRSHETDDRVRGKWEWLREYAEASQRVNG